MPRTLDELLDSERPKVVNRAKEKAAEMLLELRLAEVRHLVENTTPVSADWPVTSRHPDDPGQ
ncbi:MAG TPA: hypothetical protein VK965_08195 [Halomonas sp.]|nr:hypothetical protein [Halomonas sp.]